jgi:D-alanyl-D-alanine carboxypeptidase
MVESAKKPVSRYLFPVFAGILTVGAGYLGYLAWSLTEGSRSLEAQLREQTLALESAQNDIVMLTEALESTKGERDALQTSLDAEQRKNDEFENQIADISGTVGKLDKLSKIDPELLKKYSKVYFLNEHYTPSKLEQLDDNYAYDESRDFYLAADVVPFFEDMIGDAEDDGVEIWVTSAYRSFDTQSALKSNYSVTYGSGANTFSADQGYSEHQLGTTVDLTTTGLNGGLIGFQNTEAYTWLTENAHKYGFVLSYPENNAYYIFEPWHWRFVGTDLARDLHRDGKHFYDLDQRELDSYLISIFD